MTIQQELEAVRLQISNIQSLIGFMETTLRITKNDDPFQIYNIQNNRALNDQERRYQSGMAECLNTILNKAS